MADETIPTITSFTKGDLVVSISGDGDGSGTYTDNQATPLVLQELTTSGTVVGQMVLPQTTTVVNGVTEHAFSAEYGSSSEGLLQLSADGQSLAIAGYGINAATYNAGGAAVYGDARLAQSTSLTSGTSYTPVARVVADISYDGSVDTSTALYNVYNTNNPRSVATVDGTSFYLGGQGTKGSTNQGVFYAKDGAGSATAIDTSTDVRDVQIVNGQLYVSRDSTQGSGGTSSIASYGTLLPVSTTTAQVLPNISGTVTLAAGQENSVNAAAVGSTVHLSPESYFFANATTLYVADSGNPKEGGLGDGGLQKWSYVNGAWQLDYTLSDGLNLVADSAASGTTGLIGLTGVVSGNTVELYATNSTIGDTDQTYLYGIADTLDATSAASGERFTVLETAAADTNIRGVSFAPSQSSAAATAVTVSAGSVTSGLEVTSGGSVTVLSGGTVQAATVLSGGTAVISAGGVDRGSTIAHGATETVYGSASGDVVQGTQMLSAGTPSVSNETVYNGGAVDLFIKGSSASGLVLTNGGALNINGNATATNTVISSGGTIDLQSAKATLAGSVTFNGSGTIKVDTISSSGYGDLAVMSGFGAGDAIDLTSMGSGATLAAVTSGGNTVATVTSGGTSQSFLFAGDITASLTLAADGNGGERIVQGTASGGTATVVSSGATLTGATVTGGSTLTVAAGGAIVSATILSGGTATVSGSDQSSVISAGGTELVLGSARGDRVLGTQIVSAGTATVSAETVLNGGEVDLYLKGAVASGLVISSGGTLNISGNATATDTILTSGGVIDFESPKANLTGSLFFEGPATLLETDTISAGYGDLAVISGFAAGDAIDVAVMAASGASLATALSGGNTVATLTSGTTTQSFTFAGDVGSTLTLGTDSNGGAEILSTAEACFAAGTMIATPDGECAVETLQAGDVVTTADGPRPVVWMGHREIDVARARDAQAALLVRIRRNAFAPGLPRRDLLVTQEHCLLADGVLIPARMLVNGRSIVLDARIRRYRYHHVELARHGILMAEGLPAESYLDTGNRAAFANAPVAVLDGTPLLNPGAAAWRDAAAPLATDRALVEPVWQRLDRRADALGYPAPAARETSQETEIVLVAGERVIRPAAAADGVLRFDIPAGIASVRIRSRAARPSEAIGPFVDDRRLLGVKIGAAVLSCHGLAADLLENGREGWWAPEADGRWTTGDAVLHLPSPAGALQLRLTVVACATYRREKMRRVA